MIRVDPARCLKIAWIPAEQARENHHSPGFGDRECRSMNWFGSCCSASSDGEKRRTC
jgi:hypothetical protein